MWKCWSWSQKDVLRLGGMERKPTEMKVVLRISTSWGERTCWPVCVLWRELCPSLLSCTFLSFTPDSWVPSFSWMNSSENALNQRGHELAQSSPLIHISLCHFTFAEWFLGTSLFKSFPLMVPRGPWCGYDHSLLFGECIFRLLSVLLQSCCWKLYSVSCSFPNSSVKWPL